MGKDAGELIWTHAFASDAAGVRTLGATDTVDFELEGPGAILGVGNGDACEYVPFTKTTGRHLFGGCATAVVRRTGRGRLTLKVSSPTLGSSSVDLPESVLGIHVGTATVQSQMVP